MANVSFYLKEPLKPSSSIFARLSFNYKEVETDGTNKYKYFKYTFGEKISPKYWNSKTQKARESYLGYANFNDKLKKIENDILNVWRELTNKNIKPTPETLKKELDKIYKPELQTATKPVNLFDYIENYINNVKYVYRQNNPVPINKNTIKKYKSLLTRLKEFAKEKRKNKLNFDDINLDFYNDFLEFLQKEKGNAPNTCGKYIANIKKFLNMATEEGINTKLDFQSKRFAKPTEITEKIYLTETELRKLYDLDLTDNKRLENVRDLFLIGCYTALRYSDYTNIKPENIYTTDKGTFINMKTQKTGKNVIIPLHSIVKNILDKYGNKLPRSISNQKTNDYLKELGELAGINEQVSISKNKGGVRVDTNKPKYELITTHTARRSGATNMYLGGIQVQSIMKITGHTTEKAFMSYLRFTEEDNANILLDSNFFNKSMSLKIAK